MAIKGLSEKRRLPRLGKIRLGVMVQGDTGKPHPKATDYFVCPDSVRKVHGDKPTNLPIMFPVDDPELLFPQELKAYKTAGLWCKGDGEKAQRWGDDGQLHEMQCPCPMLESGDCSPNATLNFLLPDVPGVGVWQIVTANTRSIVGLNSALESFQATFGGLAGIPFNLILEPEQSQRWDEKRKAMVKQTLHVLRLDSPRTLKEIVDWRSNAGKAVAALMPRSDSDQVDQATRPTQTSAVEVAVFKEPPAPEHQASVEDLWTLFLDEAKGDAKKALRAVRTECPEQVGRAVDGLSDLTPAEVTQIIKAKTAKAQMSLGV